MAQVVPFRLYRPWLKEDGNPPLSQPLGAPQGRSARFSDSVVAQPEISMRLLKTKARTRRRSSVFISVKDLVSFHHFIELPAGNDVRNAAIGLNAGHAQFRNELAMAADDQHAARLDAFIRADVDDDEIVFGINHHDTPFQT